MSLKARCSKCGAPVSDEVAGGFCTACLLEEGLAPANLKLNTVLPGEKAGDRIGRYKLLQQIGEGGCGLVYMAEQEEPVRRRVALKVIKLGMDTKSVIARFEAERQALAMMDHPNIAKVFDAGTTETGRPYFVMELVRGIKITEYCDEHNLSTKERLELFTQVCHAIQHAHQKGIIHRDLKPSNILVASNDGAPVPKVIDFGIAKATQGRLTDQTLFTAFEQFIGTPAYMSPEQAELTMQDVDTRTDIYSLGVLLYELLTGKTPFDARQLLASGLDAMRRTIRDQEPERPSTKLSTLLAAELTTTARHRHTEAAKLMHLLRGDLDWIVMKALEKDRSRRYEAVNGLALDVQRHIENKPVMAGPPGRAYRFRKFVRRNRFAFATGGVVMASLIVGLVLFIWQWHRAEQANDQLAIALSEMHLERIRTGGPSRLTRTESTLKGSETYLAWPGKRRELRVSNVNQAQVYDTATDIPITPQLEITGPIRSAGFSPDESKLFILGDEPEVNLWDANVGHLLTRPLLHDGRVTFAEFSPDGKRFLTLSEARPAHDATQRTVVAMVWDVHSGTALTPGLKNDEVSLIDARFTDDGKHFVTISEQGSVAVWDSRTGKRKSIHTSSHFHIRFQTPGVSGRIRG